MLSPAKRGELVARGTVGHAPLWFRPQWFGVSKETKTSPLPTLPSLYAVL
jgi:hypothetical protein